MMNFEAFKKEVMDNIKDYLPEQYHDSDVQINTVQKNNEALDGLIIRNPYSNISPTIYLNPFYEDYQDGEDIITILGKIANMYTEHRIFQDFDPSQVTDFNVAKNQIIPRVVGTKDNMNFLNQRPYTAMADLAVVYYIAIGETPSGSMSIPITNEIMNQWEITADELFDIAKDNAKRLFPSVFKSMRETMLEIMLPELIAQYGDEISARKVFDRMMPTDIPMHVLTNEQKLNGATALLDEGIMKTVIETVGDDFYVLPSSIHEILIIPDDGTKTIEDLEIMVQDINKNEVAPQDRLSDYVYRYDKVMRTIVRA